MNKKYWAILLVVFVCSCNNQSDKGIAQVFQLPDSGSKMQETQLDQQVLYYWDEFDFRDTVKVRNPDIGEQQFVDFIVLLTKVSDSVAATAIQSMLKKAEIEEVSFRYYIEKYRHYLYDPNSPMHKEAYYKSVLDYLVRSPKVSDVDKVRYSTLLKLVSQNQVGSVAADFRYLNTKGGYNMLREGKGNYKLLVFYDPTCSHCAAVLHDLSNSDKVNTFIQKELLEVRAICAVPDRELWKGYQGSIPKNWTNGLDEKGEIIAKGLYNIQAFPTIYLLDKENRVLVKDEPLESILAYLLRKITHVS
jgi:hypothetical protein